MKQKYFDLVNNAVEITIRKENDEGTHDKTMSAKTVFLSVEFYPYLHSALLSMVEQFESGESDTDIPAVIGRELLNKIDEVFGE